MTKALWLPPTTDPLAASIVRTALAYVGACEEPAGSNRGPEIDEWNAARGAPLGSYWCASFASSMWQDAGAPTAGRGKDPSCDALMAWCKLTGRWATTPAVGAFIFYGIPGDAKHIGIVVRTVPYLVTVEGNAAWGGAFTVNGETVITRRVNPQAPNILGYGHVQPVLPKAA